jgi:hypothetical protein
MEWQAVHVLHAVDGCMPSDMATGSAAQIEEERRLLYVALTRAKRHLHVLVPQRFYVSQQSGAGDRHVYGTLTRFIPPSVEACFEAVGPVRVEAAPKSEFGGLADTSLGYRRAAARRLGIAVEPGKSARTSRFFVDLGPARPFAVEPLQVQAVVGGVRRPLDAVHDVWSQVSTGFVGLEQGRRRRAGSRPARAYAVTPRWPR